MTVKCDYTRYAINGFSVASASAEMDDVAKLIQKMQSDDLLALGASPVYKISMNITETVNAAHFKHSAETECEFYIADSVQTDTQINDAIRNKYRKINSIPEPVGKPAILTNIWDETHIIGGLRFASGDFCGPIAISAGKNIRWHVLDEKNDIVVDKNLHQIYPKKTGTFPVMIQKLLQKTK